MEDLVKDFMEMVKIDSESNSIKEFCDYIKDEFEKIGCEVKEDKESLKYTRTDGPNLVIHIPAKDNKSFPIGLSAHLDTVVPGKNIEPVLEDGKIFSKGNTILGSDDKSGIAAIYSAVKKIMKEDLPRRECFIVLTASEEIGLLGAKHLDNSLIEGLENMIVFDSGGKFGEVIVQAPSQNSMIFKITGKPAHAGLEPEKGINAILGAAKGLNSLNIGRIDKETTCNIGIIKGGKATNIVPDYVEIEGEVRSLDDNKLKKVTDDIVNKMVSEVEKTGCKIEYEVVNEYKAYNFSEDHMLITEIKETCSEMGVKVNLGSTGGGSDTNIHNERGINAVNMGTGMTNVHTTDEYIMVEDLRNTRDFLVKLLQKN